MTGRATLAVTVLNRGPRTTSRVVLHMGAHGARLTVPRWHRCRITREGNEAQFLRCGLGRLAPGEIRTLYVSTRPSPTGRVLAQEFAVTASQTLGDSRPANNTDTTRVRPAQAR